MRSDKHYEYSPPCAYCFFSHPFYACSSCKASSYPRTHFPGSFPDIFHSFTHNVIFHAQILRRISHCKYYSIKHHQGPVLSRVTLNPYLPAPPPVCTATPSSWLVGVSGARIRTRQRTSVTSPCCPTTSRSRPISKSNFTCNALFVVLRPW